MVSNFEIRSRYTVTGQKKSCGSLSSQERGKKLKNCVLLNHSRSFKFGYQGPQVVWPSSLTRVKDQSQKHWVSCLLWSFSCLGMQLDRGGRAKIYDLRNNTERYGEDIYIYIERDRERERSMICWMSQWQKGTQTQTLLKTLHVGLWRMFPFSSQTSGSFLCGWGSTGSTWCSWPYHVLTWPQWKTVKRGDKLNVGFGLDAFLQRPPGRHRTRGPR